MSPAKRSRQKSSPEPGPSAKKSKPPSPKTLWRKTLVKWDGPRSFKHPPETEVRNLVPSITDVKRFVMWQTLSKREAKAQYGLTELEFDTLAFERYLALSGHEAKLYAVSDLINLRRRKAEALGVDLPLPPRAMKAARAAERDMPKQPSMKIYSYDYDADPTCPPAAKVVWCGLNGICTNVSVEDACLLYCVRVLHWKTSERSTR